MNPDQVVALLMVIADQRMQIEERDRHLARYQEMFERLNEAAVGAEPTP